MSHKIIKPEGIELIEYLNNGYAICNRCGAVMRQTEDPKTGCGIYICPSCGLKMDEEDYEYESDPEIYLSMYGKVYFCDHPVYHCCTLFQIGEKGLAVIQQRFDEKTKSTWWGEVDPWITDDLYLHPCFKEYFDMRSGMATNGLYPTVTIRQIMWALKMKPIKRERWETVFDRRDI